jgi:hypothetical protein
VPKIVLNPRIKNNIRFVDYDQYRNGSGEKRQELSDLYENGYLIILKNYRFDAGRAFLSSVTFPNEKRAKKIILSTSEHDHKDHAREKEWRMVNEELLAKDPDRIELFRNNVVLANGELIRLVDELFPDYDYTKRMCIYNLSEMLCHNLHFDSPQHSDRSSQLRAFVNLDTMPRIWHLSEPLEDVANRYYHETGLEKTIGLHPREFTRTLTHGVYGDRYASGSRIQDKHSIAFYPGEVWFLNPNMAAHEIVYGRRLLDGVFLFDKKDLNDSTRYYPEMVQQIHLKNIRKSSYWARYWIRRWATRLIR